MREKKEKKPGRRAKQTAEINRLKKLLPADLVAENDLLRPQVVQLTASLRETERKLKEATEKLKGLEGELKVAEEKLKEAEEKLKEK